MRTVDVEPSSEEAEQAETLGIQPVVVRTDRDGRQTTERVYLGARISSSFDAVTISFGIRNVLDVPKGLREMHRVLRPGGRALILEFSLPANAFIRWGYLLYFRNVLPLVGGLVSGDAKAYRYLNETVETFPYGAAFTALMTDAGFENVQAKPLTFGIATLYRGDRPQDPAAE